MALELCCAVLFIGKQVREQKQKSSMSDHSSQNRRTAARGVADILGRVLEPVLARKTGMRLDLIKIWPEIVGEQFADQTRPEKIKWPRRSHEDDPFKPAQLIVACEPSVALFFQHEEASILERLNVFFGFQAVDRIRILQKPVMGAERQQTSVEKPISKAQREKIGFMLAKVEDPDLRETLARLGKGVIRSGSK